MKKDNLSAKITFSNIEEKTLWEKARMKCNGRGDTLKGHIMNLIKELAK